MTAYIPDLTGSNPNYLVTNDIYTLTTTGVQIKFRNPIYQSSLVIAPVGDSANPLILDEDYTFNASDIDNTTMARAANTNKNFAATLVSSVTITRQSKLLPIQVAMSYQSFYGTSPDASISNDAGTMNFSPDLLESMILDIATLKAQTAQAQSSAGTTLVLPTILEYDINGTNSANLVTGEVWTLDTYHGKSVIFPVQGSFFKDSVVVTVNGSALTYGTDYLILGVNFPFSRITSNTSGVFTFIQLLTAYAGDVSITYHAVGGEVTANVVSGLYNGLMDLRSFLNGASFLTVDTLNQSDVIQALQNDVASLGATMRKQFNGTATYGDTTNGVTVVKQVRATDTQLHWYTIASLYQVASNGVTNYTTHDRMSLHIQLANAEYMADVDVAYNQAQHANPVRIEARNVIMDPGFKLFGTVSLTTLVVPSFRVIRNNDPSTISGAYLQIGLSCPSLTENITIEDRSGVESTWILDTNEGTSAAPITPSDTGLILPDGVSTWSTTGALSVQDSQVLQNSTGYLVYGGSTPFTSFDSTAATAWVQTSSLPSYFAIKDIRAIELYTMDGSGNLYTTVIPMTGNEGSTSQQVGSGIMQISTAGAMAPISVKLTITTTAVSIALAIAGQTLIVDAFALRYAVARL